MALAWICCLSGAPSPALPQCWGFELIGVLTSARTPVGDDTILIPSIMNLMSGLNRRSKMTAEAGRVTAAEMRMAVSDQGACRG